MTLYCIEKNNADVFGCVFNVQLDNLSLDPFVEIGSQKKIV